MDQIERIRLMEQLYDQASSAFTEVSNALDKYVEALDAFEDLNIYLDGGEWQKDYAADEAGLLPSDLKRGVLSEDGLWNLLCENDELAIRMLETVKEMFKRR